MFKSAVEFKLGRNKIFFLCQAYVKITKSFCQTILCAHFIELYKKTQMYYTDGGIKARQHQNLSKCLLNLRNIKTTLAR